MPINVNAHGVVKLVETWVVSNVMNLSKLALAFVDNLMRFNKWLRTVYQCNLLCLFHSSQQCSHQMYFIEL